MLIQRKDNGLWAMPGGFFEVGETPAEGTCREAFEETGLHVEPVTLCGVYDSRFCGTQSTAHLYQFVFLCRPRNDSVQPVVTEETLGVCWLPKTASHRWTLAMRNALPMRLSAGEARLQEPSSTDVLHSCSPMTH